MSKRMGQRGGRIAKRDRSRQFSLCMVPELQMAVIDEADQTQDVHISRDR